jgi:hypothetical protein
MKSSENTLHTLIILPVAAALVGLLFILGASLIPAGSGTASPEMESRILSDGGDSIGHFQAIDMNEGVVSYAM